MSAEQKATKHKRTAAPPTKKKAKKDGVATRAPRANPKAKGAVATKKASVIDHTKDVDANQDKDGQPGEAIRVPCCHTEAGDDCSDICELPNSGATPSKAVCREHCSHTTCKEEMREVMTDTMASFTAIAPAARKEACNLLELVAQYMQQLDPNNYGDDLVPKRESIEALVAMLRNGIPGMIAVAAAEPDNYAKMSYRLIGDTDNIPDNY